MELLFTQKWSIWIFVWGFHLGFERKSGTEWYWKQQRSPNRWAALYNELLTSAVSEYAFDEEWNIRCRTKCRFITWISGPWKGSMSYWLICGNRRNLLTFGLRCIRWGGFGLLSKPSDELLLKVKKFCFGAFGFVSLKKICWLSSWV